MRAKVNGFIVEGTKEARSYVDDNENPVSKTRNRELLDCVRNVSAKQEPYSLEKAMNLLARGIPFLCTGNFNIGSVSGIHVSMVTGYKFNENAPNTVEWQHFDSNLPRATWGWTGGCQLITYIQP